MISNWYNQIRFSTQNIKWERQSNTKKFVWMCRSTTQMLHLLYLNKGHRVERFYSFIHFSRADLKTVWLFPFSLTHLYTPWFSFSLPYSSTSTYRTFQGHEIFFQLILRDSYSIIKEVKEFIKGYIFSRARHLWFSTLSIIIVCDSFSSVKGLIYTQDMFHVRFCCLNFTVLSLS